MPTLRKHARWHLATLDIEKATSIQNLLDRIRKRRDYETDSVELKPQQVIIAGLIGAAVLVAGLILLVRFVIGKLA